MEKPAKKKLNKTPPTSLKKTPSKKPHKTSDSAKISPKSKTVPKPKGSSGTTVKPKKDRVTAPTQAESQHKYYEDLGSRIAEKAYELYVQRGEEHGHDFEDWLEAERQILPKEMFERS
jgi:hypothetical protein